MRTHEYVVETWGLEARDVKGYKVDRKCQLIAVYSVDAGCPGDELTPPDLPSVEVTELYYEIYQQDIGTIEIPAADSHVELLDINALEQEIYNDIF